MQPCHVHCGGDRLPHSGRSRRRATRTSTASLAPSLPIGSRPERSRLGQLRGLPKICPNAQLSCVIAMVRSESAGTLTVAGTKPLPQQLPGKIALAITSPSLMTSNLGDLPTGRHCPYSSPELP